MYGYLEDSFRPISNILEILERETNSWKRIEEMIEVTIFI